MRIAAIVALLLAAAHPAAGQQLDARLARFGPLMDTLVLLADSVPPGDVYVRPVRGGARGEHRHRWHIVVADARDEIGLLHEFGHHYAASVPADYFEFADSLGLDPWTTRASEAFADAFAEAVITLRSGPRGSPAALRSRDGFLARRLARHRPFRRGSDPPPERAGL